MHSIVLGQNDMTIRGNIKIGLQQLQQAKRLLVRPQSFAAIFHHYKLILLVKIIVSFLKISIANCNQIIHFNNIFIDQSVLI